MIAGSSTHTQTHIHPAFIRRSSSLQVLYILVRSRKDLHRGSSAVREGLKLYYVLHEIVVFNGLIKENPAPETVVIVCFDEMDTKCVFLFKGYIYGGSIGTV